MEGFQGHFLAFLIFQSGVISGAMAHLINNPHLGSSPTSEKIAGLVGMSGGCYAIHGVHLADLIKNWRQTRFRKSKLVLLLGLMVIDFIGVQLDIETNASRTTA